MTLNNLLMYLSSSVFPTCINKHSQIALVTQQGPSGQREDRGGQGRGEQEFCIEH